MLLISKPNFTWLDCKLSLPYGVILDDNNSNLCDDLMSIVKAYAIYVRENSSWKSRF